MAEPQEDGYDSRVVLEMARRRGYRRPEGGDGPTFFDGRVAIRLQPVLAFPSTCRPAPLDHPSFAAACDLVRLWPVAFRQVQDLVESLTPFVVEGPRSSYYSHGSPERFGMIAATVDDPVELAECIVHEMAHQKLFALGLQFESAERILLNPPERKFQSPIRYDCLRPMSAVLHAQYSFTYAAALHAEIAASAPGEESRRKAAQSLASVLPKLEFGRDVIQEGAEVDGPGELFLRAYFAWLERVLAAGYRRLASFGIEPQEFVHPLAEPLGAEQARARVFAGRHSARPARVGAVREYDVADEMVLYAPGNEGAFALNSSAREIWKLCDGRRTAVDISQELGRRFALSGPELLPDVLESIAQLYRLGLLALPEGERTA